MVAVAQQSTVWRGGGGGGPPSSGPGSLELDDARPLLPGKPRNGAAPTKAQPFCRRLDLCWWALFAAYHVCFFVSLMVSCPTRRCMHACRQLGLGTANAWHARQCHLTTWLPRPQPAAP